MQSYSTCPSAEHDWILRGQTAGVLGYGSIGRECARQLHALGMRILALDPGPRRDDGYNFWPGTGDAAGELPVGWFQPEVREPAPPFRLAALDGGPKVALADLRSKPVVLVFGSFT